VALQCSDGQGTQEGVETGAEESGEEDGQEVEGASERLSKLKRLSICANGAQAPVRVLPSFQGWL